MTSMHFLQTFNAQQREKHLEEVYFGYPPNFQDGNINYHLQILKETLRNEARRLFFQEGNVLDSDGPQNDVDVLVQEDIEAWEKFHGSPPSEETIRNRIAYHNNY